MSTIWRTISDNLLIIISLILFGFFLILSRILFDIMTNGFRETILKFKKYFLRNTLDDLNRVISFEDGQVIENINNIVYHLLKSIEADKVFILMFHNGEKYWTGDRAWKVTMTNEKVRDGFKSSYNFLARPIDSIWNIIKYLFYFSEKVEKEITISGIKMNFYRDKEYLSINVNEFDQNNEFISDCGLETIYLFPIKNKTNQITSLLSVGYINENIEIDEEDLEEINQTIKKLENKIQNKKIKEYFIFYNKKISGIK